MPTVQATESDRADLLASMQARHANANNEVPALAAYDKAAREIFVAAATADWPALQRIHGDYHLGQVLDVARPRLGAARLRGRAAAPARRTQRPDLALRDVAGMLRSFDYAAGSWEQSHPGASAARVGRGRAHAPSSTATPSGRADDPREDRALLAALELDKALYEVVYEARNRPSLAVHPGGRHRPTHRQRKEHPMTPTAHPTPAPIARTELDRLLHGLAPQPARAARAAPARRCRHRPRPEAAGRAASVPSSPDGSTVDFTHEHEGVWVAALPTPDVVRLPPAGDLRRRRRARASDDPYRFLPTLGEVDLHLIGEGRHEQLVDRPGRARARLPGADGAGARHLVRRLGAARPGHPAGRRLQPAGTARAPDALARAPPASGSCSSPASAPGTRYKFEILASDGVSAAARPTRWPGPPRCPPATASVVTESRYTLGRRRLDAAPRAPTDPHTGPDEHLRGAPRLVAAGLSYRDLAEHLVNYVADLGFTHVELMPVMEHPTGRPGATRSRATTRRPRGSAPRTTSATSSTRCTRPGSA